MNPASQLTPLSFQAEMFQMILAMMRLKWSVRAKVIIARGGGGSEDFGEDHMVSRGDGVDYK